MDAESTFGVSSAEIRGRCVRGHYSVSFDSEA